MTQWTVWLADGTTRDSFRHSWDDVKRDTPSAGGVIALRWWGLDGKGVNWGDGKYGHPDTLVDAGMVSDAMFTRMMASVWAAKPPGERP